MKLYFTILFSLIYACALNAQLAVKGKIILKNTADNIQEMSISKATEGNSQYTSVEIKDNQFQINIPSDKNGFYKLNIVINKADSNKYPFSIPLYMPDTDRTYNLDIQIDNETIKYGFDKDNTLLEDYYNRSRAISKEIWTNTPSPEKSTEVINNYDNILNKLTEQYKPSEEVKQYITVWNFIEQKKAADAIRFMYRRNGTRIPEQLNKNEKNAINILTNKYAACFYETPMFFCANIPGNMNLEEKLDFAYHKLTDKNLQARIAEYLLRNYITYYDYDNDDFNDGLENLKKCVHKYNLSEEYINDFEKKRYILDKAPFPDITFYDSEGKEHTFEEFKGYYVYIDIWASWCVPCCKEIPHLQKLEKELNNPAVKFLSVSIDQNEKNWKKKTEELNLHGNQWFNKGNEISKYLNINAIPRFLLYDKEGKLMNIDATRPSNPQTKEMLEQLK